MAVSKVDPCMFCGLAPCECNKPAPKAVKPKRTPKPKAEAKPVADKAPVAPKPAQPAPAKVDMHAAMKARAKPIVRTSSTEAPRDLRSDEEVFGRAIRLLAPILHPMEVAKYGRIINAKPTLEERRAAWKAKVPR